MKEYEIKKTKGLAQIVKAGGGHACVVKKFSIDDGTEIDSEITTISIDALNERKAVLQAEIKDCDAAIADLEQMEK